MFLLILIISQCILIMFILLLQFLLDLLLPLQPNLVYDNIGYTRVHTYKENWLSVSNNYQMITAPQPRVELCSHILRFYLAWACAYLV